MLILKLLLLLPVCWPVAGDFLLDLYVQNMDEAMKTIDSKSERSSGDYGHSTRSKRNIPESTSDFRIGHFKAQKLEVVEETWLDWKSKVIETPYNNDGLDHPNLIEKNNEPGQAEFINVTTYPVVNQDPDIDSQVTLPDEDIETFEDTTAAVPTLEYDQLSEESKPSSFQLIRDEDSFDAYEENYLKGIPNDRLPKKYFPSLRKEVDSRRKIVDLLRQNRAKRDVKRDYKFVRSEKLDDDGDVVLDWDPTDQEVVTFRVTARTLGYIGIGFNEKSHMKGADILLAWVDDHNGAVNLLVSVLTK